MLAGKIYMHSLRQVLGNIGPALRISLVPTALQYGLMFAISRTSLPDPPALETAMRSGHPPLLPLAAITLVSIFCGTWIAVDWHRFVLLGEQPKGWVPTLMGERMLTYFGRSLLIVMAPIAVELALVVPLFLVSGAVGLVARPLAALVMTVGLFAFIGVLATVLFRLSTILPAAALGADSRLRAAWGATRGQNGTLLGLAALYVLSVLALTVPQAFFAEIGLLIFAVAWQVAAGWAAAMLLLSIFTTLYGHFVQNRALV